MFALGLSHSTDTEIKHHGINLCVVMIIVCVCVCVCVCIHLSLLCVFIASFAAFEGQIARAGQKLLRYTFHLVLDECTI